MTIHWCGTGLSSVPGLRLLLSERDDVKVWNRTLEKAEGAVGDLTQNIAAFDKESIAAELRQGDIIISMLPGDWHAPLAQLAIENKAHFVSSSYIAPEMRALDQAARDAGVTVDE